MTNWSFGIGDPSLKGWMITLGFFVCAFLCLKAWLRSDLGDERSRRAFFRDESAQSLFWLFCVVAMVFLGFNKQFDLQTLITDLLRYHAKEHGWYNNREDLQLVFIVGIGIVSILGILFIARTVKSREPGVKMAMIGLVFLCGYIVSRAASFHHFDRALSFEFNNIRVLNLAEPFGIVIIAIAAIRFIRFKHKEAMLRT